MSPQKIRKAVFPAAGLGTRFLPATKATPKEMLCLVDKPLIQYGVEEAVAAGCTEIIIITSRGKTTMEDHFDANPELEASLAKKNKIALLEIARSVSKLAKITFTPASLSRSDSATPSSWPKRSSATSPSPCCSLTTSSTPTRPA